MALASHPYKSYPSTVGRFGLPVLACIALSLSTHRTFSRLLVPETWGRLSSMSSIPVTRKLGIRGRRQRTRALRWTCPCMTGHAVMLRLLNLLASETRGGGQYFRALFGAPQLRRCQQSGCCFEKFRLKSRFPEPCPRLKGSGGCCIKDLGADTKRLKLS